MSILSGILGVAKSVAGAFSPKKEEPAQEPVKVEIVGIREKSHKEQVNDWMNGGEEPDKISRIHEQVKSTQKISIGGQEVNIGDLSPTAQRQILSEVKTIPKKVQKQQSIKTVTHAKKSKIDQRKVIKGIMGFMGYRPGKVGRTGKRRRVSQEDMQVKAMRSGSLSHRPQGSFDFDINSQFGSGKKKKNFWE